MSTAQPRLPVQLTSLQELDRSRLESLLARASAWESGSAGGRPLAGRFVANLFFEPSTRTRASFEVAAVRLGAHVINLEMVRSSAVKGETLVDTIRTLHAMDIGMFVIRHSGHGAIAEAAQALFGCRLALVSGGEGRSDHPTQGLVDALTVQERFGKLDGLRIAIVGDLSHSRVARSATQALGTLGAEVRLGAPPHLQPADGEFPGTACCGTLEEALHGVDVVMALRVQRERFDEGESQDEEAFRKDWQLTEARLAALAPGALVMHPGPFNRGMEITSEVADGPRSLILRQVALGVAVRMAVLEDAWTALQAGSVR